MLSNQFKFPQSYQIDQIYHFQMTEHSWMIHNFSSEKAHIRICGSSGMTHQCQGLCTKLGECRLGERTGTLSFPSHHMSCHLFSSLQPLSCAPTYRQTRNHSTPLLNCLFFQEFPLNYEKPDIIFLTLKIF